jgi:hypothetical protein
MDRRNFLLSFALLTSVSEYCKASGHNIYCAFRDTGGRYLADKRILVMGGEYDKVVQSVRRDHPAVTVLVESEGQYIRAINDIRNPNGPYPRGSIVIRDTTTDPDPGLAALDEGISRVQSFYSVPTSISEARAIHGTQFTPGEIQSALPGLRQIRSQLGSTGGIDLGTTRSTNVSEFLTNQISSAGDSELVVILAHRVRFGGSYGLRFHDGSTLDLGAVRNAKPTVWVVSCDTWSSYASATGGRNLLLATTRQLTYRQGAALFERLRGKTRRDVIHKIQQELPPADPAPPSPPPATGRPPPGTDPFKKDTHPSAEKPAAVPHSFLVEQVEPRTFATQEIALA